MTEGYVADPFGQFGGWTDYADDNSTYTSTDLYLWKDPSETHWLWVDPESQEIVYKQDYRSDLGVTLTLYYDGSYTDYGRSVSYYNFHLYNCTNMH